MPAKGIRYMKSVDLTAAAFLFVGGINWGMVGLFGFDGLARIFGEMSTVSRFIYMLIGLSAIYDAVMWKAIQRRWECGGSWGKAESHATSS